MSHKKRKFEKRKIIRRINLVIGSKILIKNVLYDSPIKIPSKVNFLVANKKKPSKDIVCIISYTEFLKFYKKKLKGEELEREITYLLIRNTLFRDQ